MTGQHVGTNTGEKLHAALVSILASAILAISKLAAGLFTGSLGIMSEAIHSLLDLAATIMTYFAVRISDKPADAEHHYGHTKIESIAALAATGLLFVASGWIIYEAIHRLRSGSVEVEAHPIAIAIIVASIAIDYFRARALRKVAKDTRSQALEADALHFSSDMYSSMVVLLGLGFVAFGFPAGDAIAAMIVSVFICKAGWELGKRTIDTLLDTAPEGAAKRIEAVAESVAGVVAIERLRIRPAGSILFVDIEVAVARTRSLKDIAELKNELIEKIRAEMPEAEVTVIAHPRALDDETVHDRVLVIARNLGLAVHHVTVQTVIGPADRRTLAISLDLEVDGRMPLIDAHQIATQLEDAIASELGEEDIEVETHIEPMIEHRLAGIDLSGPELQAIEDLLQSGARSVGTVRDVHDLRARRTDEGTIVNFHCRVDPRMTVEDMHQAIDEVERIARAARADIRRVIGHAEPIGVPHPERSRI